MHVINRINRKFLAYLTEKDHEACLSLYMPVVQAGQQTRKNPIVFKDLRARAEEKLEKYGVNKTLTAELLRPLDALGGDAPFREERPQGLAVFVSPQHQVLCRAPAAFPVEIIVDRRFYIRPLLPLLQQQEDELGVVLLGRDGARLLLCTGTSCEEVLPPGHLRSLQAFLAHYDFEKSLQYESANGPPAGGGKTGMPVYHGQGVAGDGARKNRYLKDYYRRFKNWLYARQPGTDFYLAGEERDIGIFTKIAGNGAVRMTPLVRKNIGTLDEDALLAHVRTELARQAEEEGRKELRHFRQTEEREPQKTLHSSANIVAAACASRIRTLFLPPEEEKLWGVFDEGRQDIVLERRPGEAVGEELFNLAAVKTLQNGGRIVVNNREIPGNAAALCHW